MKRCECEIWPNGCTCGVAQWERNITHLETRYRSYLGRLKKTNLQCDDALGFMTWECCDTHINLRLESIDLNEEAKTLHSNPRYHLLSAIWWVSVGKQSMHDELMNRNR